MNKAKELVESGNFEEILGLHPDPEDLRDFKLKFNNSGPLLKVANTDIELPIDKIKVKDSYSIQDKMPVIEDQGINPHCAAYAISAGLSYYSFMDIGEHVNFHEPWLYDNSRRLTRTKARSGTYLRNVLKVVHGTGAMPRKEWNEILDRSKKNGDELYEVLANYKIQSYASINEDDIDSVKQAIVTFGPVYVGMRIYQSWATIGKSGLIKKYEDDPYKGGHALDLVGWEGENFIGRNSWGAWGKDGHCLIPFDYFVKNCFSCWSAVDVRGSKDLYDKSKWEKFRDNKLPKELKKAFGIPF